MMISPSEWANFFVDKDLVLLNTWCIFPLNVMGAGVLQHISER